MLAAIEPFVYEFTQSKGGSISAEHGLGVMKASKIVGQHPAPPHSLKILHQDCPRRSAQDRSLLTPSRHAAPRIGRMTHAHAGPCVKQSSRAHRRKKKKKKTNPAASIDLPFSPPHPCCSTIHDLRQQSR